MADTNHNESAELDESPGAWLLYGPTGAQLTPTPRCDDDDTAFIDDLYEAEMEWTREVHEDLQARKARRS